LKISELTPLPELKVRFKGISFKTVPKTHGCYVLTSFTGEILYIGLAINLNARFLQHLDNSEKIAATNDGKAIWFYYLQYDAKNLPRLERTWLNQFLSIHGHLPILNKVSSPIS
jgi:hypothetical protein